MIDRCVACAKYKDQFDIGDAYGGCRIFGCVFYYWLFCQIFRCQAAARYLGGKLVLADGEPSRVRILEYKPCQSWFEYESVLNCDAGDMASETLSPYT